MEIDLPRGWTERGGGVENSYYLAENANAVAVGYTVSGPTRHTDTSYSVWAGDNWSDNKTLDASCESKSEAKLVALDFMRKHPDVRYESASRGLGSLKDSDGNRVRF